MASITKLLLSPSPRNQWAAQGWQKPHNTGTGDSFTMGRNIVRVRRMVAAVVAWRQVNLSIFLKIQLAAIMATKLTIVGPGDIIRTTGVVKAKRSVDIPSRWHWWPRPPPKGKQSNLIRHIEVVLCRGYNGRCEGGVYYYSQCYGWCIRVNHLIHGNVTGRNRYQVIIRCKHKPKKMQLRKPIGAPPLYLGSRSFLL